MGKAIVFKFRENKMVSIILGTSLLLFGLWYPSGSPCITFVMCFTGGLLIGMGVTSNNNI